MAVVRLNGYEQFVTDVDGVRIHFVHRRSDEPPLILTHGRPSTFAEMFPLLDRLGSTTRRRFATSSSTRHP